MGSQSHLSPILRYPGSKAKLLKYMDLGIPKEMFLRSQPLFGGKGGWWYCEPFIGSGAMLARMMAHIPGSTSISVADKDYWLICFWKAVYEDPNYLMMRIGQFQPSQAAFEEFKSQDGCTQIDPAEAGFRKLALHRISYSGLGYMAGSALGGKKSDNPKYPPTCRWNPESMRKKVALWHRELHSIDGKVEIACRDFADTLRKLPSTSFVYLDPPYYVRGPELYKHSMSHDDHTRLAEVLRHSKFKWLLSYDDDDNIRALYDWATIEPVEALYTTGSAKGKPKRRKNHEVVIFPN